MSSRLMITAFAVLGLASCNVATSRVTTDDAGAANNLRRSEAVPVTIFGSPNNQTQPAIEQAVLQSLSTGGERNGVSFRLDGGNIRDNESRVVIIFNAAPALNDTDVCQGKVPPMSKPDSPMTDTVVISCGAPFLRNLACGVTTLCGSSKALRTIRLSSERPVTLSGSKLASMLDKSVDTLTAPGETRNPVN